MRRKSLLWFVTPVAALFGSLMLYALPASAQRVCLPTCGLADTNDGRFLTLTGAGRETLDNGSLRLKVVVPAGTDTWQFGIGDGDSGCQ